MPWKQITDPFGNIGISALLAIVPILFIFWALIIRKMKGYLASLFTTAIALVLAVAVYRMPPLMAAMSVFHGALYGLFPICWITVNALFLFNVIVKSGQFDIIRHSLASITPDRRLQVLLISFSFGSFLEGTAGFATPVAICASMLCAIGFQPLYAAGICLIANTAPVAFGSIGIPIIAGSQVSGIPEMALSQMVGRTLPLLSFFLPFYLVCIMAGVKKAVDIWPAVLVSGFTFAFFQWFSSNYVSFMLPDVIAGIASIAAMLLLLKFWKPRDQWRFAEEPPQAIAAKPLYSRSQQLRALSPFIVLTVMVIAWGLEPVKQSLNQLALFGFDIPWLHNQIQLPDGSLLAQHFKFNILSAAGTAIFISSFIAMPLMGVSVRNGIGILGTTLKQMRFPILTIMSILGFAFVTNNSGMSGTIASALANTGVLFPFFAPILGWLGVFITGSDTSSNALFGQLQYKTAVAIGVDPVVTVAGNCSGGVVAKMISPQSIAVAAAAGGLIGSESKLFRFTVKHSFFLMLVISLIVLAQAYYLKWMIPSYSMQVNNKAVPVTAAASQGPYYLLALAIIIAALFIIVRRSGKRVSVT